MDGAVGLGEALEDAFECLGCDANAVVFDADEGVGRSAVDGDLDVSRDGGELEGVVDEVDDDALELLMVEVHGAGVFRDHEGEGDFLPCSHVCCVAGDLLDEGGKVGFLDAEAGEALFEFGEVEEVVDELEELESVAPDILEGWCQMGRDDPAGAVVRRLDGGEDHGERGAEFVGDVGEELGLHPVELLELLVGALGFGACEVEAAVGEELPHLEAEFLVAGDDCYEAEGDEKELVVDGGGGRSDVGRSRERGCDVDDVAEDRDEDGLGQRHELEVAEAEVDEDHSSVIGRVESSIEPAHGGDGGGDAHVEGDGDGFDVSEHEVALRPACDGGGE